MERLLDAGGEECQLVLGHGKRGGALHASCGRTLEALRTWLRADELLLDGGEAERDVGDTSDGHTGEADPAGLEREADAHLDEGPLTGCLQRFQFLLEITRQTVVQEKDNVSAWLRHPN